MRRDEEKKLKEYPEKRREPIRIQAAHDGVHRPIDVGRCRFFFSFLASGILLGFFW